LEPKALRSNRHARVATWPASLRATSQHERGGLSGAPLAPMSARIVRRIAIETRGSLPVIAVGGIETGADIVAAISSGATLTQTYTGFIYRGPDMVRRIGNELNRELDRYGVRSLEELRNAKF